MGGGRKQSYHGKPEKEANAVAAIPDGRGKGKMLRHSD
jgi:hypothetical protein